MRNIILASSSPRRIEMMKNNGYSPEIMPAKVDEIRDIIAMVDVDKQDEMFDTLFMMESYQKVQTKKEEIRRRIFGE